MKKVSLLFFALLTVIVSFAQNNPLWLRYPSISPDGKEIVFSFKGDLYKVNAEGGTATQLTMGMVMYSHDYDETFPRWNWGQRGKVSS